MVHRELKHVKRLFGSEPFRNKGDLRSVLKVNDRSTDEKKRGNIRFLDCCIICGCQRASINMQTSGRGGMSENLTFHCNGKAIKSA